MLHKKGVGCHGRCKVMNMSKQFNRTGPMNVQRLLNIAWNSQGTRRAFAEDEAVALEAAASRTGRVPFHASSSKVMRSIARCLQDLVPVTILPWLHLCLVLCPDGPLICLKTNDVDYFSSWDLPRRSVSLRCLLLLATAFVGGEHH